jgi:hypothetical protein
MVLLSTLWVLLVPSLAHRPHSVVTALTPGDEPGQAWSLLDPHDVSQLLSTVDGGAHWDHEASPAMEETLAGLAVDSLGTLYALAQDGSLWMRPGNGNWESEELLQQEGLARDIQTTDTGVAIATSAGIILRDTDGLTTTMRPDFLDATSLNVTCDGDCWVVATGASGGVWLTDSVEAELQPLPALPGGRLALSAQLLDDRVVVGTQQGAAWWDLQNGTWNLCGVLPVEGTGSHESAVPALSLSSEGTLLAASGHEALFASQDNCESWVYTRTGLEVAYGGTGNATDPSEAWAYLGLTGDDGIVAGFAGVAFSRDGGTTWNDGHLLRNRYTRALALESREDQPLRVYSAGYGGGATWSDDGGETWVGSAVGLDEETVAYDLLVASSEPGVVLMAGLSALYRSHDGGLTWGAIETPMERVRSLDELEDAIYLFGEGVSQQGTVPRLARSTDGGESWSLVESFTESANGGRASGIRRGVLRGQETLAVVTDVPAGLLVSTDNGLTWFTWLEEADEPAAGMEFWPPGESGRIVFASPGSGVLIGTSADEAWWSPREPPVGEPRRLVMADDGTLLLATRGGAVWQSMDGGETWDAMGQGPPCAIHDLVPAPGYADRPLVLLGTQLGTWFAEGGDDFQPTPWLERLEQGGIFLRCSPNEVCSTYTQSNQGAGGGLALAAGESVRFSTEGTELRVIAEGGGEWEAVVDGEPHSADSGLVALSGTGWKDVEIVVHAGELRVDAIEVRGAGVAINLDFQPAADTDTGGKSPEGEADDSGCGGCSSRNPRSRWPLVSWLSATLLLARRNQPRRRYPTERRSLSPRR